MFKINFIYLILLSMALTATYKEPQYDLINKDGKIRNTDIDSNIKDKDKESFNLYPDFKNQNEDNISNFQVPYKGMEINFEDIDSLRQSLENTPIAKCDEIIFSVMGLSLANINLIVLTLLIFINILFIVRDVKI